MNEDFKLKAKDTRMRFFRAENEDPEAYISLLRVNVVPFKLNVWDLKIEMEFRLSTYFSFFIYLKDIEFWEVR